MRSLPLAMAALGAASLMGSGCQPVPGGDTLLEAYRLGNQEARWDLAMPLLKAYVNAHPHDAGGHFLLGQAHLHGVRPWLIIVEGELRTALSQYQFTKRTGPIGQVLAPDRFEAAIHRELALLYMRMAYEAMSLGVANGFAEEQIGRALEHVRLGRQLDPDAEYLRRMEEMLEGLPATLPEDLRPWIEEAA